MNLKKRTVACSSSLTTTTSSTTTAMTTTATPTAAPSATSTTSPASKPSATPTTTTSTSTEPPPPAAPTTSPSSKASPTTTSTTSSTSTKPSTTAAGASTVIPTRSHAILGSLLLCPVCKTLPRRNPAFYVRCANGHSLCADCAFAPDKKPCPMPGNVKTALAPPAGGVDTGETCLVHRPPKRDHALESLTLVPFSCCSLERGCPVQAGIPELAAHMEECPFRFTVCPVFGCGRPDVLAQDLVEHIRAEHGLCETLLPFDKKTRVAVANASFDFDEWDFKGWMYQLGVGLFLLITTRRGLSLDAPTGSDSSDTANSRENLAFIPFILGSYKGRSVFAKHARATISICAGASEVRLAGMKVFSADVSADRTVEAGYIANLNWELCMALKAAGKRWEMEFRLEIPDVGKRIKISVVEESKNADGAEEATDTEDAAKVGEEGAEVKPKAGNEEGRDSREGSVNGDNESKSS